MFQRITGTFNSEVEAAQSVSRERVRTTLEHDCTWLVHLHDFSHDLTVKHVNNSNMLIGYAM